MTNRYFKLKIENQILTKSQMNTCLQRTDGFEYRIVTQNKWSNVCPTYGSLKTPLIDIQSGFRYNTTNKVKTKHWRTLDLM